MTDANEQNLLKQPNFLWVLFVQTLGCFNDTLFKNAVIIIITFHQLVLGTLKPASFVALCAAAFIFPLLLLSPLAGQLATKYSKSQLMTYCKLFEIITSFIALFALLYQIKWLFLVVLLGSGVQSSLFVPVKLGMVPEICTESNYLQANSLFDIGLFLASIAGTVIGASAILLVFGPASIASLLLITSIVSYFGAKRINYLMPVAPNLHLRWNSFKLTYELFMLCKQGKVRSIAVIGIAWFWAVVAIFLIEMANFVKHSLGGNQDVVSLLLTSLSVGIAIGAVICTRLRRNKIEFGASVIGCLGISGSIILLLLTPHYANANLSLATYFSHPLNFLAIISTLSMGIFSGLYMVPLYALLHHDTTKKTCAKIICFSGILNALFIILAALFTILLIQIFGFYIANLFLIVCVLNLILNFFLLRKDIRFKQQFIHYITFQKQ